MKTRLRLLALAETRVLLVIHSLSPGPAATSLHPVQRNAGTCRGRARVLLNQCQCDLVLVQK